MGMLAGLVQLPPERFKSTPHVTGELLDDGGTLFGSSVVCVGDVDKDGRDDIAVSAPLAWSKSGRTGQVLILSGTDGGVLRELSGDSEDTWFGNSVFPIELNTRSIPAKLAISCRRKQGKSDVNAVKIVSFDDLHAVATIPGAAGFLGSPGDLDSDRSPDYAVAFHDGSVESTRWISGQSWQPLDRPSISGPIKLLAEDYDGDKIHDYLSLSRELKALQVCSGASGKCISTLKLGPSRDPRGYRSAICTGLEIDGKRAIVLSNPDKERGSAAFSAFSGVTGELALETTFGKWSSSESDQFEFSLVPSSDTKEHDIFFAVRTPFFAEELQAYSGKTLEMLWKAPYAVEKGTTTLATLRARHPFPASDWIVAVGKLRNVPSEGSESDGGEVAILSAATGQARKYFHERDYPMLSLDHYPELQEPAKK
ncbi:MAG TPA: integrin alpha [Planctomycetota bacterium]|nr:integrin alpha [Planctomycetota bacterium]